MNQGIFQRDFPGMAAVLDDIVYPAFGKAPLLHEDILADESLRTAAKKAHIEKIFRVAEYEMDGAPFNIFDVELASDSKLSLSRVAIKRLLVGQVDVFTSSLIFFHYAKPENREWRISYFAKGRSNRDTTAAKRYTFLCGKGHGCRTIAERFELLKRAEEKTRDVLTQVFSVESLNREFYKKLANWFFWALEIVRFPEGEQDGKNNAVPLIRLITRLIFVWFMRKKGLVPEQLFQKSFVDSMLRPGCDASAYYKAILQNLFFATLNTEQTDPDARKFIVPAVHGRNKQYHVFSVYRYEAFFTDEGKKSFLALMRDIPFLNGGLFACLDDNRENTVIDAFSDNQERRKKLYVPDELFWTPEEENRCVNLNEAYGDAQHGREQVLGLITLLDQYNFTIDENSRDEATVALDPELLGAVFENLLASYNPETATTARKQTGSFYTPREIVDYMVEESVIRYLLSRNIPGVTEDRFRELLNSDSPSDLTDSQKDAVMKAIRNCRILDPACGSGAFPMGLLQNLVRILEKLDPVGSFKDLYLRKLHLIQNCIYGVDIQPIAVQISKLRCFISLLADSEVDEQATNRGIEPLPNLEMHFVAANSLLDIDLSAFEEWFKDTKITAFTGQLKRLREQYFAAKTHAQKKSLRQQDDGLRAQLREHLIHLATSGNEEKICALKKRLADLERELKPYLEEKWEDLAPREDEAEFFSFARSDHSDELLRVDVNADKRNKIKRQIDSCKKELRKELRVDDEATYNEAVKLADWDPFDQMATAPFFNPGWMFGSNGGFDIVIGNPPYVRADNPDPDYRREREAIKASGMYETLHEKWDLFIAFLERGYQLLSANGIESFIVSDAYCHAKYAQKSQEWFLRHARIPRIDFCGDLKIFEAAVHNVIPFFEKADGADNIPCRRLHTETFGNVAEFPTDTQNNLTARTAFFPEDANTEARPELQGIPLERICYISVGMVVHANEKIAKGEFKLKDLVSDIKDDIHQKPFVEGKFINRWERPRNRWLEWNTERAPAKFRRPTFPQMYDVPVKLISVDMAAGISRPKVILDERQLYHNHSAWSFVPWHMLHNVRNRSIAKSAQYKDENVAGNSEIPDRAELEQISRRFSPKYLLAVMNSAAAKVFLMANRISNLHLFPDDWKKLPIPEATPEQQRPIIAIVDQILATKQNNHDADISQHEFELDKLVRKLYFETSR